MEKKSQLEKDNLTKIPIFENDSEEEKKEYNALLQQSSRTWQEVQRSLSSLPSAKTNKQKLSRYSYNETKLDRAPVIHQEEEETKVPAYDYIHHFLMLRAKDRKFNISVAKLIHATDIALIVSDDQVDVDIVQTSANR